MTPGSGKSAPLLVDTSIAVALSLVDHEHYAITARRLGGHRLGLAGHAAFETFSVLTRLPPPARKTPATVARLLAQAFPETRYLGERAAASLLTDLRAADIAGGAVYDALVGATAREHRLRLATRDRRALDVYRVLDVQVELLD
ncbi:MAG: type II toxin-antitoxin system VapC family toxin [Mycobacterium sp.]